MISPPSQPLLLMLLGLGVLTSVADLFEVKFKFKFLIFKNFLTCIEVQYEVILMSM